jgi:hypothetical protein
MMRKLVLGSFGFYEPGPDGKENGAYREFSEGQILTEADCTAEQAAAWEKKGHIGDPPAPAAEPVPEPVPAPVNPLADHT